MKAMIMTLIFALTSISSVGFACEKNKLNAVTLNDGKKNFYTFTKNQNMSTTASTSETDLTSRGRR